MGNKKFRRNITLLLLTLVIFLTTVAASVSAQDEVDEDVAWGLLGLSLAIVAVLCIVFLLIAIVCAVWIYKDAEKRGKSGALWAVLMLIATLFFFPIGTIIIAVVWLLVRPPEMGPPVAYGPPPQQPYYPPQQPGYPPQQPPRQPGY